MHIQYKIKQNYKLDPEKIKIKRNKKNTRNDSKG